MPHGVSATPVGEVPWPPFPHLETERLTLREFAPRDAEALFEIYADEESMRYWSCRPFTSMDQADDLVARMTTLSDSGAGIHWAITLKGNDRVIGKCGFNEWRRAHRRGDISYIVRRDLWGKGIVGEALGVVLDYGFGPMKLHSVEAGVTPGNDGSTRLLEKLGFRLEGHLHERFLAEDVFVDSLIYSLLARDWHSKCESRASSA